MKSMTEEEINLNIARLTGYSERGYTRSLDICYEIITERKWDMAVKRIDDDEYEGYVGPDSDDPSLRAAGWGRTGAYAVAAALLTALEGK